MTDRNFTLTLFYVSTEATRLFVQRVSKGIVIWVDERLFCESVRDTVFNVHLRSSAVGVPRQKSVMMAMRDGPAVGLYSALYFLNGFLHVIEVR